MLFLSDFSYRARICCTWVTVYIQYQFRYHNYDEQEIMVTRYDIRLFNWGSRIVFHGRFHEQFLRFCLPLQVKQL